MSDSDDYFDDNFVLDASLIAVLDEQERRSNESQRLSQRPLNRSLPPSPPLPKRQKIGENEALPRPGTDSVRRMESLPEIYVQGDGSYVSAKRAAERHWSSANHVTRTNTSLGDPLKTVSVLQTHGVPVATTSNGGRQSRSITPQSAGAGRAWSNQALVQPSTRHVSQSFEAQDGGESRVVREIQENHRSEVERLRAQLQELVQAQERTQKSLKDAQDVRMAKEGEVSILRKAREKAAQEHAAEVTRIKAAKEAAEATQLQMQKTMKEEMDQMRTQFTFKQHEWETSVRPGTVRPKKTCTQQPLTPVPMPSQIRQWSENADPSHLLRTPSRRRFGGEDHADSPRHRMQAVFDRPKKPLGLPGFVNAFDSTPPTAAQATKGKGKEREHTYPRVPSETSIFADNPARRSPTPPSSPILPPPPPPLADISDVEMGDHTVFPSGDNDKHVLGKDTDTTMAEDPPDEAPTEESDVVSPPNWTAELHHIIFMHKLPSSKTLTIQALINTPLSPSSAPEHLQAWNAACKALIESLGTMTSQGDDMQGAHGLVAASLVQMAGMLKVVIPLLTALLSMLRVLTTRIPFFPSLLLSHPPPSDDAADVAPHIITVLCDIIRTHLMPTKEAMSVETVALAQDTLGLLETFTWNIPDLLIARVAVFVRTPKLLSSLLSPSQPTWLLYRATRILATLASHFHLFRTLLSFPDPESSQQSEERDFKKIPHVEQLAQHLSDSSRDDSEASVFKETILAFIASLCVADAEALTILVGSETLIPAIVVYLSETTSLIWEENEQVMESPALIESTVMKVVRTVLLLYRLVFESNDASFRLRQKLVPTTCPYWGTLHMFIVTAGRLSYGDIPHAINGALRRELEQTRDMAKDMLELVVSVPELEMVWSAFQSEDDAIVKVEDEDEKEARIVHTTGADAE